MQLKRRVALNGVWLDSVDNRIVVSGIEPADGRENISAVDAASGYGQRITGHRRSTLDMVVRFSIFENGKSVTGMQNRAEVLEKVNAWASPGGLLTVNYKPGRQLRVVLAQAPGEGSLWDYTKEFQITFRAYAIPYWEDSAPDSTKVGSDGTSGSKSVLFGGSADTQTDVELKNMGSSTANAVTVTVDGKTMTFSSLGLVAGESLIIDHVDGLVRIRIKNGSTYRSAMDKRSGANDLIASPGSRACSYTADQNCRMTVNWRSRYL